MPSLIDVLDVVLGRGIVIDASVQLSLVEMDLILEAPVVIDLITGGVRVVVVTIDAY